MGLSRFGLWWIPLEDKKHLDTICEQHGISYKEKGPKVDGVLKFSLANEDAPIVIPYVRPNLFQGHLNEMVEKWRKEKDK